MDRIAFESQIQRILSSHTFSSRPQLRRLLQILAAHHDSQTTLKPDRVMRELWPEEDERTPRYLATATNRLRNALEEYYAHEGTADDVLIRLPRRSGEGAEHRGQTWITAEMRGTHEQPPPVPSESEEAPPVSPAAAEKSRSRWRWAAIAGSVLLCAVLAAALIRFRSADDQPSAARLDGNTLVVVDGRGKELWSRSFPDGFWQEFYKGGLESRMWFGDLDGRGETNVLLVYQPAVHAESRSSQVICYAHDGQERWRWNPGRVLPELANEPAVYQTVAIAVLKANAGAPARIVVTSTHYPQYPTQVALVSAGGKTLAEYWHSGHLDLMGLADLDGDGRQQILGFGESNGYNQATLVVLDPDHLGGASLETARPELQIHGMGIARERYRLLFARSDINRATNTYNYAQEMTFANGVLRLAVRECGGTDAHCFQWYEFDRHMNLRNTYADDRFRESHDAFYRGGHVLTAQEEQAFWKVRCLAGCTTDFVPVARTAATGAASAQ